jgi:tetratricopeptide (TPR) repeat protein
MIMTAVCAQGQISLKSERVHVITQMLWNGKLVDAVDSISLVISEEPANPLGFFLKGLAYYSILNQYRNDNYADSANNYLDTAITMSQQIVEKEKSNAEMNFILGSSFGCRALYRSLHTGWWSAFRDGQHSCSYLEKAYEKDTTLTDALSGVGAYHYWKSAKAKILTLVPFVGNKRKQGLEEMQKGITSKGFMYISAIKSMLPVYYNEKRYGEVLAFGDSLIALNSLDPNSRLHLARAYIASHRFGDADSTLDDIQSIYRNSPYYDSCGAAEALYLKAQSQLAQGDTAAAKANIEHIISMNPVCTENAYFRQTAIEAKNLLK